MSFNIRNGPSGSEGPGCSLGSAFSSMAFERSKEARPAQYSVKAALSAIELFQKE